MDPLLDATARAEEHHFWFRGLRRFSALLMSQALAGRPAGMVVDCGAGTGRNLDWLKQFGPSVGVELNWVGLRHGRAAGRRVVRGSVTSLPIASGSAQVATSFDVLYCLDDEDERRALEEMWRILQPGGIALINVAALDLLHGSHSALSQERRRYTPAGLRLRLERAGFGVERMSFTNCAIFPATLAIRTFDRLAGRASVPSESDLQVPVAPLNVAFDLALRAEAVLLRWLDLPIGTSVMAVARKPGADVQASGLEPSG